MVALAQVALELVLGARLPRLGGRVDDLAGLPALGRQPDLVGEGQVAAQHDAGLDLVLVAQRPAVAKALVVRAALRFPRGGLARVALDALLPGLAQVARRGRDEAPVRGEDPGRQRDLDGLRLGPRRGAVAGSLVALERLALIEAEPRTDLVVLGEDRARGVEVHAAELLLHGLLERVRRESGPAHEALPVVAQLVELVHALAPRALEDVQGRLVVRPVDVDGDEREVVGRGQLVVEQRERLVARVAARVADDVLLERVARRLADAAKRLVVVRLERAPLRELALFEQPHEVAVARAERDQGEPHLRPRLVLRAGSAVQQRQRAHELLVAMLALGVGGEQRLAQPAALAAAVAREDLGDAIGLEHQRVVDGRVLVRPDRGGEPVDDAVDALHARRPRGDRARERAGEPVGDDARRHPARRRGRRRGRAALGVARGRRDRLG